MTQEKDTKCLWNIPYFWFPLASVEYYYVEIYSKCSNFL